MSKISELLKRYGDIIEKRKEPKRNKKIMQGKVRYYDAKRDKGVIMGDDGVMYDIVLNPSDKRHQEYSKKIAALGKNGKIKFDVVDDPDFDMAIISDKSF